jgi:hypothetical protein
MPSTDRKSSCLHAAHTLGNNIYFAFGGFITTPSPLANWPTLMPHNSVKDINKRIPGGVLPETKTSTLFGSWRG